MVLIQAEYVWFPSDSLTNNCDENANYLNENLI